MSQHLVIDPNTFNQHFDRSPFYLTHSLGQHPLFQLDALEALATRLPDRLMEWSDGRREDYAKFDHLGAKATGIRSCAEAIHRVDSQPTWVMLREVEHDALYRRLLDELLDQIRPLSEPLQPGMRRREGFIFISSSDSMTPFHFDPEHNFLLQVRGEKLVQLWSPTDENAVSAAAIDDFYAGKGDNRNQPFHESMSARAWELPLTAGQGVHFPLHAPHRIRTTSDVSVSFSITFRSRRSEFNEYVHAANGMLRRRWAVNAPRPGKSVAWDIAAHAGYRAVRKINSIARRLKNVLPPN